MRQAGRSLPEYRRIRGEGSILDAIKQPELAAEILSQPDRFRKNGPGYRELRQALGENMLTSEDESWHRQRRFLAPIFTRRHCRRPLTRRTVRRSVVSRKSVCSPGMDRAACAAWAYGPSSTGA